MNDNIYQIRNGRLHALIALLIFCWIVNVAQADEYNEFVEANILGVFYHELGHALIDIEEIPIFGQEEDAVDTFSIFLIDELFQEREAEEIAYDVAIGFWKEAEQRTENGEELAWWDVHGPDEQRFFNTICLFYGANPEERESYAADLGLPEERAEYCAEEFSQADASWGAVFDTLVDRGPGETISLSDNSSLITYDVIELEIRNLNSIVSLSEPLVISVRDCDEANAFYDPEATEIVMCSEFEEHLYILAE